jgi:hypothetical protein
VFVSQLSHKCRPVLGVTSTSVANTTPVAPSAERVPPDLQSVSSPVSPSTELLEDSRRARRVTIGVGVRPRPLSVCSRAFL